MDHVIDIRKINQAIKENQIIIKTSNRPHERDMARCRINILKEKKKTHGLSNIPKNKTD